MAKNLFSGIKYILERLLTFYNWLNQFIHIRNLFLNLFFLMLVIWLLKH